MTPVNIGWAELINAILMCGEIWHRKNTEIYMLLRTQQNLEQLLHYWLVSKKKLQFDINADKHALYALKLMGK